MASSPHSVRQSLSGRGGPAPGFIAALLTLGVASAGLAPPPVHPVELRGRTYFLSPPWKVDLVAYRTDAGQRFSEYFFSIDLAEAAGAPLGALAIQQISGPDWQFPFHVDRTRAFLGRPRREGAAVPVDVSFDADARRFLIRFTEPVEPGNTITVSIRPWYNPIQSGTYQFQVTAFPAGENANPSPVGVGTLRIYSPSHWGW